MKCKSCNRECATIDGLCDDCTIAPHGSLFPWLEPRLIIPSILDQRRLKDVADALALPEPSIQELESHIAQLSDAILAAQSLDDLGSVEANNQADQDAMFLAGKRDALEEKLEKIRLETNSP